jgi:hypothetical protein
MRVVPKNAGVALLISFFLPGVGSMYAYQAAQAWNRARGIES